jgi:hypothetical protein
MANPRGQQRDKPFRDALRMEIAAAGEDQKILREIARNLLFLAATPTKDAIPAIIQVGDRLDGKPAQAIENGDDGPLEVLHRIERVIVRPANKNG